MKKYNSTLLRIETICDWVIFAIALGSSVYLLGRVGISLLSGAVVENADAEVFKGLILGALAGYVLKYIAAKKEIVVLKTQVNES